MQKDSPPPPAAQFDGEPLDFGPLRILNLGTIDEKLSFRGEYIFPIGFKSFRSESGKQFVSEIINDGGLKFRVTSTDSSVIKISNTLLGVWKHVLRKIGAEPGGVDEAEMFGFNQVVEDAIRALPGADKKPNPTNTAPIHTSAVTTAAADTPSNKEPPVANISVEQKLDKEPNGAKSKRTNERGGCDASDEPSPKIPKTAATATATGAGNAEREKPDDAKIKEENGTKVSSCSQPLLETAQALKVQIDEQGAKIRELLRRGDDLNLRTHKTTLDMLRKFRKEQFADLTVFPHDFRSLLARFVQDSPKPLAQVAADARSFLYDEPLLSGGSKPAPVPAPPSHLRLSADVIAQKIPDVANYKNWGIEAAAAKTGLSTTTPPHEKSPEMVGTPSPVPSVVTGDDGFSKCRWDARSMDYVPRDVREALKKLRLEREAIQKEADEIYAARQKLEKKYRKALVELTAKDEKQAEMEIDDWLISKDKPSEVTTKIEPIAAPASPISIQQQPAVKPEPEGKDPEPKPCPPHQKMPATTSEDDVQKAADKVRQAMNVRVFNPITIESASHLLEKAKLGHFDVVLKYLERNPTWVSELGNNYGFLHHMAWRGGYCQAPGFISGKKCIKRLCELVESNPTMRSRFDVNQLTQHSGETALHIAAERAEHDIVMKLLRMGARTDIRDRRGFTALELASSKEIADAIEAKMKAAATSSTPGTSSGGASTSSLKTPPPQDEGHALSLEEVVTQRPIADSIGLGTDQERTLTPNEVKAQDDKHTLSLEEVVTQHPIADSMGIRPDQAE